MLSQSIYFVDVGIISQIFIKNIWYLTKLLMMSYVVFYWLPIKIFPQEHTGKGMKKVVINFVYMVAYVETVVTFLVFIKAFSILLFIFTLIGTRLAFAKWYYKKEIISVFSYLKIEVMMWFFKAMDKTREVKEGGIQYVADAWRDFYRSITLYGTLRQLLFYSVFIYVISTLISRGLYSYSNPIPDTSQFIEWVNNLQNNILFSDNRISSDFYGQAIIIFFASIFTNLDTIVLFSIYPILLLMALYFSIFYIVEDFTGSKYIAIFAVMIHGMILMSPMADFFLGKVLMTASPHLIDFHGLRVYLPVDPDIIKQSISNANVPYLRYISGLAYEHASVFVILNAYFLIKTLETHLDRYLILYALTLMLVFIFHGGGAIVLIIISILIAINALIFGKINKKILKKGFLYIILASIVGNLWILSMIKYGIPQDFGAAAPFLDKLLGTTRSVHDMTKMGTKTVSIVVMTYTHLVLFLMVGFAFISSFFTKNRFLSISFVLIIVGIFIPYFGPNFGLPLVTKQSRLAEYLFFAITFLFSLYFFYFIYKPISVVFKKYTKFLVLAICYMLFISLSLIIPRWMDTNSFWKNINAIEYTSISEVILKIDNDNRPFDWTVVSYVQEYAKVRNKGYHINTQDFIMKYNPSAKDLKIDTSKIYLFVENFPNPYKGKGEWYYRWRDEVQNGLKSWIAIYSATHSNIKIYYKTNTITVYEIDNSEYVNYIKKMERLKNGHF